MSTSNNSKHKRNSIGSLAMELSRLDDEASINIVDEETVDDGDYLPRPRQKVANDHNDSSDSDDFTLRNNSDDTEELCELGESLHRIMEGDDSTGSMKSSSRRVLRNNSSKSWSDRFRRTSFSQKNPDLVATGDDFHKKRNKTAQTDVWKKRPDRKVDQSCNLMANHESWVVYESKNEAAQTQPLPGRPSLRSQTSMVDVFLDATSVRSKKRDSGKLVRGFTRNKEFVHRADFTKTDFQPSPRIGFCGCMIVFMAISMSVLVLTPFIMDKIDKVGNSNMQSELEEDSILPLAEVPKSSRLAALEYYVVHQDVTDQDQLQQEDSPVNQALRWMANEDPAELEIPGFDMDVAIDTVTAEQALLQRYALAVLFFSVYPKVSNNGLDSNGRRAQTLLGDTDIKNQEAMEQDWLTDKHICEWHGVTCDDMFESVITIELPHHNLQGTIPREVLVGNSLPYMRELVLSHNQLYGKLPKQTESVERRTSDTDTGSPVESSLEKLVLTSNMLTGTLDNLTEMKRLTFLDVQENRFEGVLPGNFGDLSNLHTLSLSANKLSGDIPSTVGSLTQLRVLDLRQNKFESNIPSVLGQLSHLQRLLINENDFQGSMPIEVCQLIDREENVAELFMLESDCATGHITCDCCSICH